MTITRALTTLKLLDKRIQKAINNSVFANYTVGGEPSVKEYSPDADLQACNDLIAYRAKLKNAIMLSNSTTTVEIGDKTMTVIEAIEFKESIDYKRSLLNKMLQDLKKVESTVNRKNEEVQDRLDTLLQANFGKDIKAGSQDYESIAKPFLNKNEVKDVDSDKYVQITLKLDEEIDTFESEIDLVLSESNATTLIDVD